MSTTEFDIAIVGAGPAGATCLLALAGSGLRILLIEKAAFPREKACGDAVPGLALTEWSLLSPPLVEALHRLPSARALGEGFVCGPGGGRTRVSFVRPGLVVRRSELDDALLTAAKAATPCTHVVSALKKLEVLNEGFRLETADGQSFQTHRLAAADGATGPCRRLLTGQAWQPQEISIAVRTYLRPEYAGAGGDSLALWFDKAVLPGYLWAFPLADGTLNIGIGTLGAQDEARARNLKPTLSHWAATPASDERPFGQPDTSAWLGQKLPLGLPGRPASGPGWVLLGDAAGLVAPATGDGIGQAAFSGRLAAQALVKSLSCPGDSLSSFLKTAYDAPLYARLGAGFAAQRRMVWLGTHAPWALEGLIRLAGRWPWLRQRLASL